MRRVDERGADRGTSVSSESSNEVLKESRARGTAFDRSQAKRVRSTLSTTQPCGNSCRLVVYTGPSGLSHLGSSPPSAEPRSSRGSLRGRSSTAACARSTSPSTTASSSRSGCGSRRRCCSTRRSTRIWRCRTSSGTTRTTRSRCGRRCQSFRWGFVIHRCFRSYTTR